MISGKHGKQIEGSESADILQGLVGKEQAPGREEGKQSRLKGRLEEGSSCPGTVAGKGKGQVLGRRVRGITL